MSLLKTVKVPAQTTQVTVSKARSITDTLYDCAWSGTARAINVTPTGEAFLQNVYGRGGYFLHADGGVVKLRSGGLKGPVQKYGAYLGNALFCYEKEKGVKYDNAKAPTPRMIDSDRGLCQFELTDASFAFHSGNEAIMRIMKGAGEMSRVTLNQSGAPHGKPALQVRHGHAGTKIVLRNMTIIGSAEFGWLGMGQVTNGDFYAALAYLDDALRNPLTVECYECTIVGHVEVQGNASVLFDRCLFSGRDPRLKVIVKATGKELFVTESAYKSTLHKKIGWLSGTTAINLRTDNTPRGVLKPTAKCRRCTWKEWEKKAVDGVAIV